MNYENWISYRYLMGSKGRFLSFLTFVSIAGVGVGVMALIVVTGIMTGFGNNLRDKIIGTTAHISVEKETGIQDFQDVQNKVAQIEGITGAAPYVQGNIFLESDGHAVGELIRGIDPAQEKNVTKIKEYLRQGSIDDLNGDTIIIGTELARYFGYKLGDKVTLIAPGSGIAGRGWRYELTIVGIFNTGMVDYDMSLVIVNLKKAQQIFDLPEDAVTGIGIRLKDPYQAKEIKQKIYDLLSYRFLVKSWIDVNRNLFEALFLEKWGLFLILTLMVLIAAFNIASTLIVPS